MAIFKYSMSRADQCMVVVLACVVIDLVGLSLTIPILANFARLVQGDAKGCPTDLGVQNETLRHLMLHSEECQKSIQEIKANTGILSTAYASASFISTLWMPIFFGQVWSKTCDYDLYIWKLLWFSWTSHNCPIAETTSSQCASNLGDSTSLCSSDSSAGFLVVQLQ